MKRELNISVTKRVHGAVIPEATDGFVFDYIVDTSAVTTLEVQAERILHNICMSKGLTKKSRTRLCLFETKDMKKIKVNLYSTGFTSALLAVINACYCLGIIDITVYHYDSKRESYFAQKIA